MVVPFKMVSLQFDDGLLGVYDRGVPYLNKVAKGAVGTIAVTTDWVNQLSTSSSPLLNWEQLRIMRDMGWEIQDHKKTGRHLTDLTDEEIHQELQSINDLFTFMGWDVPTHSYIPGRMIDDRVENIVRQYRKNIINLHTNTEILPDLDRLGINYASRRGDTQTESRQNYIKQTIDELENGKYDWVIIRGHDIRDEPTTYQYCYYTRYFEDMVDYIVSKDDIKFVTIEQGLRLQKAWKEAGLI